MHRFSNQLKESLESSKKAFIHSERLSEASQENLKIKGLTLKKLSNSFFNFISTFNSFTENEISLPHLLNALNFSIKSNSHQLTYFILFEIGSVYKKLRKTDEALSFYLEALKLEEKIENDDDEKSKLRNEIGEIYFVNGDLEKAKSNFAQANQLTEKTKLSLSLHLTTFNNLALLFITQHKYEAAKRNLKRVVDIGTACQDRINLAIAHKRLSILYEKEDDYSKSKLHHVAAHSIQTDYGTQIFDKDGNKVETEYS